MVGAISTGVVQWAIARRLARAEARAAARLINIELRRSAEIVRYWLEMNSWWWPYWESPRAWSKHQSTLALSLRGNAWSAVEHAYARLDHIGRSTDLLVNAGSKDYDSLMLKDDERAQLKADADDLDRAVAALARFTRDRLHDRPTVFTWRPSG